jgi:hypothetical protein
VRWIASVVLAVAILVFSVVLPGAPTREPLRPPPGLSHLTETQAITSARGASGGRAAARLMDYGSAAALLGGGADPAIDPTAPVWVVTVYRPTTFTVILDSVDGAVIDSCIGCRSL